jgi:hypothetical protein
MHTSFQRHPLSKQHGMGATIILFTIALIVLVGAALAYGSRGNSKAFSNESAKIMSSVLLKQSAEYRDAYNRYIFDGGTAAAMKFDATSPDGLFNSTKQYGIQQDPPAKAFVTPASLTPWDYSDKVIVTGVGSGTADSIVYVAGVTQEVCEQINTQLYGGTSAATKEAAIATVVAMKATSTITSSAGKATGCIQLNDLTYVFYSTLAEN